MQCTMPAVYHRHFCAKHWLRLPRPLQVRIVSELARLHGPGSASGSFSVSVTLAVRWIAVDEGILPKPKPEIT